MPELPEVETVVRELNRKLKNQTIQSVEIFLPKIVSLGPGTVSNVRKNSRKSVDLFTEKIQGYKIKSVKRRAKLILFFMTPPPTRSQQASSPARGEGNIVVLAHLKMTGQFIYLKKPWLKKKIRTLNKKTAPLLTMPCKHTHAVFTFNNGSKLFFNDSRQFGYLKLVANSEIEKVRELKEFGPEPLSREFTQLRFFSIAKKYSKRKMAVKPFLMDPKSIAGIGNIYSDEILFHAGVRPGRRVFKINRQELKNIFNQINKTLKKGIAAKGSSVGDFIRTDGKWGSMGKYLFVYGRKGQKCKVCGSLIKSEKFAGRTGSFCPKCQT